VTERTDPDPDADGDADVPSDPDAAVDTDTSAAVDADPSVDTDAATLARAADAIRDGGLVVYPTETVYGLGADASDPAAVERVFERKRRPRDKPLSLGVPDVETARRYARLTPRDEQFVREFLPGPVTVVVEADPSLPDALTAGRDRVGVRIPAHDLALALFRAVAPLPVTATSANVSGSGSVRRVSALAPRIRDHAVVVDGGEAPGTESTVVDPSLGVIHRRGARADAVEAWLEGATEDDGNDHGDDDG
jgi:L-threonylcarbamoyladenylate synthase